jgi:hypothetical protein
MRRLIGHLGRLDHVDHVGHVGHLALLYTLECFKMASVYTLECFKMATGHLDFATSLLGKRSTCPRWSCVSPGARLSYKSRVLYI